MYTDHTVVRWKNVIPLTREEIHNLKKGDKLVVLSTYFCYQDIGFFEGSFATFLRNPRKYGADGCTPLLYVRSALNKESLMYYDRFGVPQEEDWWSIWRAD